MYRILIIEDDQIIREELKILLENYGYLPLMIDTFQNVIEQVISAEPQLVLLDINLPVCDGFSLCREIRRQSGMPIIVVTSRDSELDELMSMNLGADDFVTKPYHTQILLARISALLNRIYNAEDKRLLRFSGLTLNIGKSVVDFRGKSTELTKNERKMLAFLMRSKGEIVSRDDLMNELWQSNEFVDDNTLTVNINRLRKKLEELGATGCLKTKRGQGYSL